MSGSDGSGPIPAPVFPGYEVLGELGRGGMGVVYRARDLRRGEVVALKTLAHADSGSLYRFKNEFRGFASLSHRNLVSLYDLVSDGDTWFFTMECVEGRPFLDRVRRNAPPGEVACDVARLRPALTQLAEGVAALHRAGKVHRDVKPSNVLVTEDGRVVLLDFGLGTEASNVSHDASRSQVVGTLDYMAPEQGFGRQVSGAADWYSVGVLLHEALTGVLPFGKRGVEGLMERHQHDPPAPSSIVIGVPEDLDRLAVDLLRREPSERPGAEQIVERLSGSVPQAAPPPAEPAIELVGRERHLEALEDAYAAARRGTVLVFLEGRSGMGKTALARRFLDTHPEAVVLSGRCYERESVRFKALDAVIDSLSRHLGRLSEAEVDALLPRDPSSLTQMFPVLRRVPAVDAAASRGTPVPDPIESRRRASQGLREVLARIGDRKPLILFVDDLQWGDADSAVLLTELLRPPDAPRLLFLGCHRSEDAHRSPFLDALKPLLGERTVDSRRIAIEPLTRREAADLCLRLIGRDDALARAEADRVALEAEGSPLFAGELAQAVVAGVQATGSPGGPSFQALVAARMATLSADSRRILEAVAVAGSPLRTSIAASAAGVQADLRGAVVPLLRGRLLRFVGTGDLEALDAYHDRVRDVVSGALEKEAAARVHGALARVLEADACEDSEALARHWEGAGDGRRAAAHLVKGAEQAVAAFAFEHAVSLYRRGIELESPLRERRALLLRRLAEALVSARRGTEGAAAYLEAANHADERDALDLRRLAGGELLHNGRIDEGTEILEDVLRRVGLSPPTSPRRTLIRLVWVRLQLRLRGLSFRPRPESDLSPDEIRRLDLCFAIGSTYSTANTILGRLYLWRYVLFALRAGEPRRVAHALFLLGGILGTEGAHRAERARAVWQRARTLLDGSATDDEMEAWAWWTRGGLEFGVGDAADGLRYWPEAESRMRAARSGSHAWALSQAILWKLRCQEVVGRIDEISRQIQPYLREAQERMDLFGETDLRVRILPVCFLAADDPEGAIAVIDAGIARWSRRTFFLQHLYAEVGRTNALLYRGAAEDAHRGLAQAWSSIRRSLLMRIELVMTYAHAHFGRSALAASCGSPPSQSRRLLRLAEKAASRVGRATPHYAAGWAHLLHAGVAAAQHVPGVVRRLLVQAEADFEKGEMALYLAVSRRQRGLLEGGEGGRSLVQESEARIRDLGVKNPARWSAMYAPGFEREA